MENTKERVHNADERLRAVITDVDDAQYSSGSPDRIYQKHKKITAPAKDCGYFLITNKRG